MKTHALALVLSALTLGAASLPRNGDELRFCLHGAPRTLDPLQASDSPSETLRFLTAGVLLRQDRRTQQLTPELASGWRVGPGNREIEFTLRDAAKFSDGSAVTPADVLFTMKKVLDPALHSPVGDAFRFGKTQVTVKQGGPRSIVIAFPKAVAGIAAMFDGVPILSAKSPEAVAGPYVIASYRAGSEIVLRRNAYYWKKDERGVPVPYIAALRIRIQSNRDLELLDFERGDIDMIPELSPDLAERLAGKNRAVLVDLGLTLDSLVAWFNQVPGAPLAAHKKVWFQSVEFRKALSLAVNRDDICRIAYLGKARPGVGPVSPANRAWFNAELKADAHDLAESTRRLRAAGFTLKDGTLFDAQGNRVEFALATNAGNKTHERVAGLLQQDWKRIGIRLTVVTLDFPSLIERITHTFNYEAAMLPLTNIGLDPEDQMNLWLSTSANHQWNPNQASPATAWEKETDELMARLASSVKPEERKRAFDRVQVLVKQNVPFVYIAHPQAQAAVASNVKLAGAPLWPYLLWGLEQASFHR